MSFTDDQYRQAVANYKEWMEGMEKIFRHYPILRRGSYLVVIREGNKAALLNPFVQASNHEEALQFALEQYAEFYDKRLSKEWRAGFVFGLCEDPACDCGHRRRGKTYFIPPVTA